MKKLALTLIAIAALALAACTDRNNIPTASPALADGDPQQYTPAQPQQVVQQTAPASSSNTMNMLLAGGVGYMLGKSSNNAAPVSQPTTVIHQTIVKRVVVQPNKPAAKVLAATPPSTPPSTPPAKLTPTPSATPASKPAFASIPKTTIATQTYKPMAATRVSVSNPSVSSGSWSRRK